MGIRYFAISIDLDDYERVSAGPCPTCGTRPTLRKHHYDEPEPDTLDLDKSWGYLQRLFDSQPPRPASALVEGNVTHDDCGWIPFHGAIAPDRVGEIATDLAAVTPGELRSHFQTHGRWYDARSEQDFDYVKAHLADAVEFTAKVAAAGRAIAYYIG